MPGVACNIRAIEQKKLCMGLLNILGVGYLTCGKYKTIIVQYSGQGVGQVSGVSG